MVRRSHILKLASAVMLGAIVSSALTCRRRPQTEPEPEWVDFTTVQHLDQKSFINRTSESFPTGYLTLIAIIQGVALAILLGQAQQILFSAPPKHLPDGVPPAIFRVLVCGEFAAGFTAILVTTYMYLWFTTIMRWVPTFLDTLVPYTLGVAEIVPLYLLEQFASWWVAMAILGIVGGLAYAHTVLRSDLAAFSGNERASLLSRRMLQALVGGAFVWAVGGFIMAFVMSRQHPNPLLAQSTPWLCPVLGGWMIALSEVRLRSIYDAYKIRWTFKGNGVTED